MKKLTVLLCVAALLCGCSSKNEKKDDGGTTAPETASTSSSASTDNTEPTTEFDDMHIDTSYEDPVEGKTIDVTEMEDVSWDKLYREELEEFKKSDDYDDTARFTVYDINDDQIPELIISYGPMGNKTYLVKSLNDTDYTEFDKIENCADLCYIMKRSLLATFRYNDAEHIQTVQLYRLKNDKFPNVYTYQLTDNTAKVNGKEVTEDEYTEEYNHFFEGVLKSIGMDHSFDDDIVNAALGGAKDWKEAYCAVLNDYLKYKKENDDNHFSLMDISGDGVPELFVSGGYHYAPYVDVFAWNGCPVPVGTFGADGTMLYYADKNEIATKFDGPSYTSGSIYNFTNVFKFEEAFTYGDNENSKKNDENVELVYYLSGEKTDKDTYTKTVKERTSGKYYVLGQDNDITEDTIKALAEGKYTEAEMK
jgi:hypothetical protein